MANKYNKQGRIFKGNDQEQHSYFEQEPSNYNDEYIDEDGNEDNIYQHGQLDSIYENQHKRNEQMENEYYYGNDLMNVEQEQGLEYENENVYTDQDDNGTAILNALESLAQNESNLERDYAECEQEYDNEFTMKSSMTAFEKEELDLLNENFAILTQKNQDRKRREKLYNDKIIKTRDIIVADIADKVEPIIKRLKPQLKRIKAKHIENRKNNNLKFIEAKNQIEYLYQHNIRRINEEMKNIENKKQELNAIVQQIKTLEQERGNLQEKIQKLDKQFELEQKKCISLEEEINSIDINLLENEYKTQLEEFFIEETSFKEESDKLDEMIQSTDITLNKLNEDIISKDTECKEMTKNQKQITKDNEQLLKNLQTLIIKTHEHLEKLTLQNNIEKENEKYEQLNLENTKLTEELIKCEENKNRLNKDIDDLQKEEQELNTILCKIQETVDSLDEEYKNVDIQIKAKSDSIIETKKSELDKIKEIKMMEFDQEIKILQKQLEEFENEERKIIQRLEETKLETKHEEETIEILIEQLKIQTENLNIDLNNCECLILHTQQEIEQNKNNYISKLENIRTVKEEMFLKESGGSEEHIKNVNISKENIQVLDQTIEDIVSKLNENQSSVTTLQEKVKEAVENETKQEQKINELCGIIKKQENELNSIDKINKEDLIQIEDDLIKLKIQVEEETDNIENARETLKENKMTIDELKRQLKLVDTERTTLLKKINETTENISREKTFHENKKNELVQSFTKKQNQNQHLLEQMKKSYANKLVFHTQDIEKLKNTLDEINNTRNKIKEDMDQCADKETELVKKIDKKKIQLESLKNSAERIKNILEQSGHIDLF